MITYTIPVHKCGNFNTNAQTEYQLIIAEN